MKKIVAIAVLLVIAIGAFIGFRTYNSIFKSVVEETVSLKIYQNTSLDSLTNSLDNLGVLQNKTAYNLLAGKMNLANNIHTGYYSFEKGTSLYQLIKKIRGGLQTPIKLTFNNMVYKEDLAASISKQLLIDSSTMISFLNNEKAIDSLGFTKETALCLFIPNTYEMYWNASFDKFITRMKKEHDAFWNDTRKKQATDLSLTTNEVYILASIVEKEYKHPEERKRIAGVYINRLGVNMKLQADPTVKYAVGDLGLKRVLFVHTEVDNPYNTYYYAGLPPGPICLPETSTIDAVLQAEKHKYIYFCASPELDGYHVFNETHAEHAKTAKLYQEALNKLKIYE